MTTSFSTVQAIQPWPAELRPNIITLNLLANTSVFTSPFSRSGQTQELAGQLFTLSLGFPPLENAAAKQVRAFLARLRGQAGRFYFCVNWHGTPVVAYGAEALHNVPFSVDHTSLSADSTDFSADATVWPYESVFTPDGGGTDPENLTGTLWINSGDCPLEVGGYISYDDPTTPVTAGPHRCLHLVTAIETVGTSTTITLEPPMVVQPTATTPIHIRNASGVFRLDSDDQTAMTHRPGHLYELSLSAIQARPLMLTL